MVCIQIQIVLTQIKPNVLLGPDLKLFAKATSKQQKVPLMCKELCVFQSVMKMLLLKNSNLRMAWPRYSFAV